MLKEFAEYINHLKDAKVVTVDGKEYCTEKLVEIIPNKDYLRSVVVYSLDAVVQIIKQEGDRILDHVGNGPLFICIENPRQVSVFTSFDERMNREIVIKAAYDGPVFQTDCWMAPEDAVIKLRSMFVSAGEGAEGLSYLLEALSNIDFQQGTTTSDNGVSQSVEMRKGVMVKSMEKIKPIVTLAPFRTFSEVPQPASEFLFRLDDNMNIGLFEADGGAWKLEAKDFIAHYFEEELSAEIADGKVVVMR